MKVWIVYEYAPFAGAIPRSIWSTEGKALLELDRLKARSKEIGYTFDGSVQEAELDKPDCL